MSHEAGMSPSDQVAARDAAAEEREHAADEREAALEVRESLADEVLAAQDSRGTNTRRVLDDAERRDQVSDARDASANEREVAASRAAFLDHANSSNHQTGIRRDAALDRSHSKSDRTAAATDRMELAGEDASVADEPTSND